MCLTFFLQRPMHTQGLTKLWLPRDPAARSPAGEALVARVLRARGLMGDAAREFLEPTLGKLHDPSLMPDLDKAAAFMLDALEVGEGRRGPDRVGGLRDHGEGRIARARRDFDATHHHRSSHAADERGGVAVGVRARAPQEAGR